MIEKKYIEVMLKTPLFQSFDFETLKGMTACLQMRIKEYNKGEYITNRGETFENIGILVEGEAAAIKENALGQRNIIELLSVGNVFGEMAAFSKQNVWYFTVQAQNNCKIIFIPKGRIIGECAKLCQCHRVLIENFLSILSERGLHLDKKIEYLTIKSIIGKISAYLYDQYKLNGTSSFEIPLNRNELAEFLNVSRPTLSRELARLKDDEIIDYYLNTFRINDLNRIKELSII